MRCVAVIAAVSAAMLASSPASATVGGPRSIELLGFDRARNVVWYLEHDGSEAGEAPRLFALSMRGSPGSSGATPADERAVEALRATLEPLVALPATEATVHVRCGRSPRARARVSGPHVAAREIDLRIVRGCEARVRELVAVPGTTLAIAVVRYVGLDVESGYELDRAVRVRLRARARGAREAGPVRVRLEAVLDDAGAVDRLDLARVGPRETHVVTIAWAPGECQPISSGEIACGGARFAVRMEGGAAVVARDGRTVARAHVDGEPRMEPTFAFTEETRFGDDGRVACALDHDCRIVVGATTVVLEPMRGHVRCAQRESELACLYTHTTNLYAQRAWLVDVGAATARVAWEPAGSMDRAVEGPRWIDDGIELVIERLDGTLRPLIVARGRVVAAPGTPGGD